MNTYSFDDLVIGKREAVTFRLSAEDVHAFVALSGDGSSIHVDDAYARQKGFKRRIVHGMLSGAYVSCFLGMTLPGKHGLLQSINYRFHSPCYVPSLITIEGVIVGRSEAFKLVTIQLTITDDTGAVTLRAEARSAVQSAQTSEDTNAKLCVVAPLGSQVT